MIGIYQILNLDNGKRYIGQSNDVQDRIRHHISELRHNRHRNSYLQNSWNLHGEDSFQFDVIEECTESELSEREIYWISYYNTCVDFENCCGYNLTIGGEGTRKVHPVLQFDLSGNFIKEWDNGIIASQQTGINVGTIYGTCVKRLKRADRYIFVYKEDYEKDQSLDWYCHNRRLQKVEQYSVDGDLIKVWDSCSDIISEIGINPIACLTHATKSCHGYIFKYQNDDSIIVDADYCNSVKEALSKIKKSVIYQIDINANIVNKYNSLREAGRDGWCYGVISQCCRGIKKSYCGYIWSYEHNLSNITPQYCESILGNQRQYSHLSIEEVS